MTLPFEAPGLPAVWVNDPRLATVSVGETLAALPTEDGEAGALPPAAVAEVLPGLEIVTRLAAGGMGEVCLARQPDLDREVAVKRVHPGEARALVIGALLREARLTGRLEHPNVVPVHALGRDAAGAPFFVMKRVEGVSFGAVLRDPAHPAWTDLRARHGDRWGVVVAVLTQVANALSYAHARGLVHRDVKPDNVMLGAFGEVYLVDWGIAAEIGAVPEDIAGTPGFMAPEMVDPSLGPLDARTDVYLLGATLHEALVGQPRHDAPSSVAALVAALASAPVAYAPEVPPELGELANAATSRDPAQRPPSAAAFREGLARFERHRASRALGDAAALALAAGRAGEGDAPAAESRRRYRALSEARFGFRQALREWPGNPAARAGLRAALTRMVAHELSVESPESARGLYEELREAEGAGDDDTRDEAILADIARVEEALAARRAQAAGVDRLQRDMDAAPTAVARAAGFGVVGLGLVIAVLVAVRAGGGAFEVTRLFALDLAGASLFAGVVFVARNRLFVNEMGRRLTWTALLQGGYFVAADLLALVRGGTAAEALAHRSLGIACAFGTTAVLMLPSSRWQAAYMTAVAFVVGALPPSTGLWAGLGALLGLIALSSFLFATGRVTLRRGDVLGD